ncbi:MAG: 50S ribosomal protein L11 methyltransferase [Pelovirga sp.]
MKEDWISLDIRVRGALVELAGAVLAEQGCCGTLIEDRVLDSFIVPDTELDAAADYSITAYFATGRPAEQLVADLEAALWRLPAFADDPLQIKINPPLTPVDWAQNWKQNFSSFRVGDKLVVHPSWETVAVGADEVAIEIDPGMAFGTGTHATTRLCLEVIADLLRQQTAALDLLDVGTGSGILAIGAAALGCARVMATDIDPVACAVARDNVAKNQCADRVTITGEPLETLAGQFDLVVANILAEENVRLKNALIDHVRPGGWLVLSGILKEKAQLVSTAFNEGPLRELPMRSQDDWVCLVWQRY